MARKRAWVTPNTPPPETIRGRLFEIANDPELVGAVTGALLPLTHAENWEQLGSMTADAAAEIMSAAFEAFVNSDGGGGSEDCPDCVLPSGERAWRQNPVTRQMEYFNEELGDWEFPDGDPVASLPAPEPREDTTDAEKICNAAANVVNVVYLVWQEMLAQWDANVEPALAQVAFATEVAGAVGGAFYPPMLAVTELAGAAWALFFEAFQLLTIDSWDALFIDDLRCAFKAAATLEEDDTVTFDLNAAIWHINLSAWGNLQWVVASQQAVYILSMLGQEAVNTAGGTTAVTGDCSDCGNWCVQITDFSNWTITTGALTSEHFIKAVDTPDGNAGIDASYTFGIDGNLQTVRRVAALWAGNQYQYGNAHVSGTPVSQEMVVHDWNYYFLYPTWLTTPDNVAIYSTGTTFTIRVWASVGRAQKEITQVQAAKIIGTGDNPLYWIAAC